MIYAVASGKGGTGKTTVAASLIALWGGPVTGIDLDVEEPNLHLFLNPEDTVTEMANMEVPVPVEENCTKCRKCADLCQFKAITVMGEHLLVFPEMCHGCGGCLAVCPEDALVPGTRELGEIIRGTALGNDFFMGRLRVGEAMSPPLMRAVMETVPKEGDVVIDSPPGVSCPAVSAVMNADCIVLVTEPTPFGFHDFRLAWEAFSPLGKPMGAVINRAGVGDDSVQTFCREKNIPIWAEIPFDRRVAEAYSRGEIPGVSVHEHQDIFMTLKGHMTRAAQEA